MAKQGHREEAILLVLREAESRETVVEVCRKHGINQQTFYRWRKKYAGLGLSELRDPRQKRRQRAQRQRIPSRRAAGPNHKWSMDCWRPSLELH
jgi:putative transposase